jgi:hypothetical protein
MLIGVLALAFINLAVLAAAVLTSNKILASIVIGLSAVGLCLLAIDWLRDRRRRHTTASVPEAPAWPGYLLDGFRVFVGIAAIVVSQTAIVTIHGIRDPALHWAVFLLGVFILFHFVIELIVDLLPVRAGRDEQVPNPFDAVAPVLVTTPGVVLGLLAVFGTEGTLTIVVKVAAIALATALLLGIVINGLVSMQDIGNPPRSTVIRLMFNLSLWALVLGVLGVAMGVVYRT